MKKGQFHCPISTNEEKDNIYLYTYHNPCSEEGSNKEDCTDVIKKFAKECGNYFNYLIIGYEEKYKITLANTEQVINTIHNVGIVKISAQPQDYCKDVTQDKHCRDTQDRDISFQEELAKIEERLAKINTVITLLKSMDTIGTRKRDRYEL